MIRKIIAACLIVLLFSSCLRIVRPGEVGVKRRMGKLKTRVYKNGSYFVNPFTTKFIKVPVRVVNIEVNLESLPSKEGLSISTQLSILVQIMPDSARSIITNIGVDNYPTIITNVLRSAAADVTASYYAKDMHSGGKREEIEKEITQKMNEYLVKRGVKVDAVLLKSLRLPEGLTKAIEDKLKSEQEAQMMEFILNRERSEAERKKIEAEGIKESNKIVNESLNDNLLKYKSIEAFRELSNSQNSKVIITDGKTPMLISDDK